MTIADYHISNVIRTYTKHIRSQVHPGSSDRPQQEDILILSEDSLKRMVFEKIDQAMAAQAQTSERGATVTIPRNAKIFVQTVLRVGALAKYVLRVEVWLFNISCGKVVGKRWSPKANFPTPKTFLHSAA